MSSYTSKAEKEIVREVSPAQRCAQKASGNVKFCHEMT